MEKTKILFVMPHMGLGGAARALVTLLNDMDYQKYDVDVLLIHGTGFNLKYFPDNVNVIGPIMDGNEYYVRFKKLIKSQLKKGRFDVVLRRIYYAFKMAGCRNNHAKQQYYHWKFLRPYVKTADKTYDIAVGYLDGTAHYYVIDKVTAQKKICWVHSDYSKMDTCKKDIKYLKRANVVATISPNCVESIRAYHPSLDNVKLAYNLNSPSFIKKMAQEPLGEDFESKEGVTRILSIGRLTAEKAYHFAIGAAKILKDKGYKFKWGIIGNGHLKDELSKQIEDLGVSDCISLLGLKENPYPYINAADIIVQCSIYEGKSIALDEAKILQKPIVCTNYNSAKDQIEDGVSGILVPINEQGVADGVEKILTSPELAEQIRNNLNGAVFEQNDSLKQHEQIFTI